jgi:hypothetical protein
MITAKMFGKVIKLLAVADVAQVKIHLSIEALAQPGTDAHRCTREFQEVAWADSDIEGGKRDGRDRPRENRNSNSSLRFFTGKGDRRERRRERGQTHFSQ